MADEAAAELAASGDPPPLPCAEPAASDRDPPAGPLSRFDDRIGRLAARYRNDPGTVPDVARASLAELLAWCIAIEDDAGST